MPTGRKRKTDPPAEPKGPLAPLWILLICISVPLLAFGVLVGAKKCSSRLWVPGGFVLSTDADQGALPSTDRSDPVGQEYTLKYVALLNSFVTFLLYTFFYKKTIIFPEPQFS